MNGIFDDTMYQHIAQSLSVCRLLFFPLILGQGILRELQTVGSRTTTLSHSLISIEAFQRMCILKCDLVLERLQMEISLNCSLM